TSKRSRLLAVSATGQAVSRPARLSSRPCALVPIAGSACSCSCHWPLLLRRLVLSSTELITRRSTLSTANPNRGSGVLPSCPPEPKSRPAPSSTWAARMPPSHCCALFMLSYLLSCSPGFQQVLPVALSAALALALRQRNQR